VGQAVRFVFGEKDYRKRLRWSSVTWPATTDMFRIIGSRRCDATTVLAIAEYATATVSRYPLGEAFERRPGQIRTVLAYSVRCRQRMQKTFNGQVRHTVAMREPVPLRPVSMPAEFCRHA
jgi:hypothetical protein